MSPKQEIEVSRVDREAVGVGEQTAKDRGPLGRDRERCWSSRHPGDLLEAFHCLFVVLHFFIIYSLFECFCLSSRQTMEVTNDVYDELAALPVDQGERYKEFD